MDIMIIIMTMGTIIATDMVTVTDMVININLLKNKKILQDKQMLLFHLQFKEVFYKKYSKLNKKLIFDIFVYL